MSFSKNKKFRTIFLILFIVSIFTTEVKAWSFGSIRSIFLKAEQKRNAGFTRFFKKIITTSKDLVGKRGVIVTGVAILGIVSLAKGLSVLLKFIEEMRQKELDDDFFGACEQGDLERVKRVYKKGANLKYKVYEPNRHYGVTEQMPIHVASQKGHTEVVKYLVENGVDIDSERDFPTRDHDERYTPFIDAVIHDRVETVKYLVENGADINFKTRGKMSWRGAYCGDEGGRFAFVRPFLNHNGYLVIYLITHVTHGPPERYHQN